MSIRLTFIYGTLCPLALLTTRTIVGIIDSIKAELILDFKYVEADGSIIQTTVWKISTPVPPTTHGFKYRRVYSAGGMQIVGFDNERGKGDHRHSDGKESICEFFDLNQLIEGFIVEVGKRRK